MIFITLFAAVYLHISARTAEVGRQIQVMQNDLDELDRQIEDMRSQLALIKSSDEMEKRADALGFKPVVMDEITFLVVPGFVEPALFTYQQGTLLINSNSKGLPAEFTESLFEWLKRKIAFYMVVR